MVKDCSFCGSLKEWFEKFDIKNQQVRYFFKDEDAEANFGYLEQWVDLGNGHWLVGINDYDDRKPDHKFGSLVYYNYPDDFTFDLLGCDDEEEDNG